MEYLNLEVKEVIKETADSVSVHFKQPENKKITYKSGQFLTFIVDIDGKEERRAYSLCSSPVADADLAVAVKRVNKGLVSNYINDNVKKGDIIKLLEPMGTFTFTPDTSKERHLVLLGGGSGITPMFSILKTALKEEPKTKITLVYANQSKASTIFRTQLDKLEATHEKLEVIHYLDEENQGKKKLLGLKKQKPFLTKDRLKGLLAPLNINKDDVNFFICGPQGMMKVAEETLLSLKFPSSKIKKESFVSDKPQKAEKSSNSIAKFKNVKVKYLGQEYNIEVKQGTPVL